jgi:hypothetical protein
LLPTKGWQKIHCAFKGEKKPGNRGLFEFKGEFKGTGKILHLDNQPNLKAVEREAAPTIKPGPSSGTPTLGAVEITVELLKKRRGRRPGKVKPVEAKPGPQLTEAPAVTSFIKYDNFEELLLFSTAHSNTAKILLAAAYLQEKENLKEFSSYDISCLFKNISEEVSQSSAVLSSLLGKNPPLLVQTGTQGTGEKSRRNFRVTEEGIRIARNYIKE